MQLMTLDEMREHLKMPQAWIVKKWREGTPVDGRLIRMEERPEGKMWWLEGENEHADQAQTSPLLKDSGVHGRTVGAFERGGIETAEQVANLIKDSKTRGAAVAALREVDGVGEKGALDTLDWLAGLGVWAEAELAREHRITCPHCDGLFDILHEVGGYGNATIQAKCTADAEYQTVQGQIQGNCGAEFWIEPTTDGYRTHKQDPTATSEVHEEVEDVEIEVVPEPVPAEVEADAAPETPEVSEVGEADMPDAAAGEVPNEPAADDVTPSRRERSVVQDAPRAPRQTVPLHERIHPGLSECRAIGTFQHDSPEWHAARKAGVGSSDAGAILGLNPHATNQDVWRSKVGEEVADKPWLENYSAFGTWFEQYIREWAEEASGVEIIDGATLGTLQSIHWPQARANIDGIDQYGTVEEYKTTSERWTDIPAHYEAQVQHQLFVTGADTARIRQFVSPVNRDIIPALLEDMRALAMFPEDADRVLADWLIKHGEFYTYIIERDEKYIERLLEREKEFWGFVESNVIPPFADPDGTVDLSDEPEVYAAVEEFARMSGLLESFKQHTKAADEQKKKARREIERILALRGETPKRLKVGKHKATFVSTEKYSYWNIYAGEVEDDVIPF